MKTVKVAYNKCHGGFSLSPEAVRLAKKYAEEGTGWDRVSEEYGFIHGYIERHDDVLVRVIEELGSKVASGDCSEISIEEVSGPYYIEEYGGNERLVTPEDVLARFTHV
jgi:hypothetical protein